MAALVSELGPLGLGLGSPPDPDSMDPFAVEAPVKVFSPQVGWRMWVNCRSWMCMRTCVLNILMR